MSIFVLVVSAFKPALKSKPLFDAFLDFCFLKLNGILNS